MFKKRPTKAELRDQLSAEVTQFLNKGGEIKQVEMGASGLVDGRYNQQNKPFDRTPPQERTPVHGLLATIDARRKQKSSSSVPQKHVSRTRKKIIYDDFGEPVRTVWIDE